MYQIDTVASVGELFLKKDTGEKRYSTDQVFAMRGSRLSLL